MSKSKPLAVADVIFSLKTFAAAMLAYWIALRFGLKNPYWAVGTVYIVAHPLSGATVSKAFYRLLGTALGAVMTVVLVPNLVSSPEILSLALALWTGTCLFVSMLDRSPRSYIFMLAGYTVVLTGFTLVSTPLNSFDTAVSRLEEIGIGILCVGIVSRVVWPQRAGAVLARRVDTWMGNAASLTRDVLAGQGNVLHAIKARQALAVDAVDLRGFTTHVGYETRDDQVLAERMTALQQRMIALLPLLSEITDAVAVLDRSESGRGPQGQWLERIAVWVNAPDVEITSESEALLNEFQQVQQYDGQSATWRQMIVVRLAKRLHDLVEVWHDCRVLRGDMASGTVHTLSLALTAGPSKPADLHTDYGMALLSALAVVVAVLIACTLWIGSGWTYGWMAAQMAAILCCVLATIDDALPALRKVMGYVLMAVVVTFIYKFAVMPLMDGFVPLICALGLFLIPVGVLMAIPARWLLGFQLSVNLIYQSELHNQPTMDFSAFANVSLATVIGILIAMMTLSTVRSIGAEASARRLLRAGWSMVIESAATTRRSDGERMVQRMLDQLGLLVPRLAAIAPGSDLTGSDILRDLRVGLNILKIQRNKQALTGPLREVVEALLVRLAEYYRAKRAGHPISSDSLLAAVDDCLARLVTSQSEPELRRIRDALVGLRSAVSPDTQPALPGKEMYA